MSETRSAPAIKEIPRPTQKAEIQRVATNLFQSRGRALANISEEQKRAAFASDPANEELYALYHDIDHTKTGEKNTNPNEGNDSRPIRVRVGGKQLKVKLIKSFDGQNFVCAVEGSGGGTTTCNVSKEELYRGQLVAVSDRLINSGQFSDSQRALLKMYIGLQKGEGSALLGVNIDEIITTAAEEQGIVAVDDVRAFVESHFEKLKAKNVPQGQVEGVEPVPAELTAEQLKLQQQALQLLEGKNLADFATFKAVLDKLGAYGGGETNAGGTLGQYFQQLEVGEIDVAKAKQVKEAVRQGETEGVLGIASSALPSRVQEEAEGPKTPADIIIQREIEEAQQEKARLEAELAGLGGEQKKEKAKQIADQIKLLGALQLGVVMNGELGVFFKARALRALYDIKGVDKVTGLFKAMEIVRNECRQQLDNLVSHVRFNGKNISPQQLQELVNDPENDLEKLMTSGSLEISGNLQRLFFGKEVTPEEQEKLIKAAGLSPEHLNFLKKHGKEARGGGLILLLLLLMGAKNAFTDLAMPQRMAA